VLDYYDSSHYHKLEVEDELSLTILNDKLILNKIIYLKGELVSTLMMNEVQHIKGFFQFLKDTDQI
jgi:hypothetical protein